MPAVQKKKKKFTIVRQTRIFRLCQLRQFLKPPCTLNALSEQTSRQRYSTLLPLVEYELLRVLNLVTPWQSDDAGSALGKVPSKRSHLKSLVYPARTRRRRLWCGASGKRDGRQGGQGGKGGKERECIVFASIQRAHGAAGGCWGALEGVSAGCRVGRCCRVKDVNARDTSRALGSAFAMYSTPSVKASQSDARAFYLRIFAAKRWQNAGNSPRPLRSSTRIGL